MIKNGSNALAIQCFADHPGQPLEAPKDQDRKKGKGGKTVSSYFKGQLDDLMGTLYKTEPHFIRCVVPNTHKQPGGKDIFWEYKVMVSKTHWFTYKALHWENKLKFKLSSCHRCRTVAGDASISVQWRPCRNSHLPCWLPK